MSDTLERTGLDIAALLLAAVDLGSTFAAEEISLGAVTPDPAPLTTWWGDQPRATTVFTHLMERPCTTAEDHDLADLFASWWEAGYAARYDALETGTSASARA